jgi:hypothetical protein
VSLLPTFFSIPPAPPSSISHGEVEDDEGDTLNPLSIPNPFEEKLSSLKAHSSTLPLSVHSITLHLLEVLAELAKEEPVVDH